ncbi:cyclin-D4-1-like [Phalaenopsis equestris]|uniref:cyclin-D4-1-like n=1 Tax=Phalaenopsis equestris TaxID=78828 RepID=UPI0009E656B0|nr:cyclin-D4-1-like [Phalaenopsis equestris]
MGISYEYASSILLCAEENSSILGLDEEEEEIERHWSDLSLQQKSCDLYGSFFMAFPLESNEYLCLLMEREAEHMPRQDYAERLTSGGLDIIRTHAIDWILKVHAYYNFGHLSAYLSVNYLDRFLSFYELPKGKTWITQLLSVSCLSLAAKMEEEVVPLLLDLQVVEAKFVFEAKTIQRMELLLLSTLKWRMQAVTPFSFMECFFRKLNGGNLPSSQSISRAVELILKTIRGIAFLSFKPSEIAAATTLSVKGEASALEVKEAITHFSEIDKMRVLRCYEAMQEEIMMTCAEYTDNKNWIPPVTYMPQSPNGVLDAACLSYKSDEMISGSRPSSHHFPTAEKRRKISRASIS